VLGVVELHGTRNISWGRDALVYPGVYLETQGSGVIEIGNGVVLSRGVHIVAFERVVLDDDCMVGEYSSIRDANHKSSETSVRNSGHDSAPIVIERNVWIGRGVTVLKGVHIGRNSIVGANAVVTRSLPENSRAGGVPARIL
jgi:acetyltransferase-like isoleucine patch superfamily enzyme